MKDAPLIVPAPATPGHVEATSPDVDATSLAFLRPVVRALVGADAAEDVVQETWLRLVRARPAEDVPLGPWLVRVARNLAVSERRRESARKNARLDLEPAPSPEAIVERAELERRLLGVVGRLREPYLSTVLLRYGEGLTSERIGVAMGVPAGTVRWRLRRALATLREALEGRQRSTDPAWMKCCTFSSGEARTSAGVP